MENRVGIYCRLSNEDRDKDNDTFSESIKTQKAMLVDYCLEQGWNVSKIYIDDNFSGGNQNRPAFKEMIEDCESRNIDIVLCKSQSRFSREISIIEYYLHNKFLEWGVRFVSVVDNIDTNVNSNKKTRQINGLINEWYLEDVSANVRSALKTKMKKGEYVGAFTAYGYMKNPENKHQIIVDPVASQVVKQIFDWYTDGEGAIMICKKLNNMNIPSPTAYKQLNSSSRNYKTPTGKYPLWTHSTISKMIVNEVYIGNLIQGKQQNLSYKNQKKVKVPESQRVRIDNNHEPIIDKNTWILAQEIRVSKTRNKRNKHNVYPPIALKSKLYCGDCGLKMCKESSTFPWGQYQYIFCPTRRTGKSCSNGRYRIDFIEQCVLDEINGLLDKYYDESLIAVNKIANDFTDRKRTLQTNVSLLKSQITKKENTKFKLYEDKIDGNITQEDYIAFSNKVQADIESLQLQINEIEDLIKETEAKVYDNKSKEILSKYKHIEKLDKNIVQEFIDKIELNKDDNNEPTIKIYWQF